MLRLSELRLPLDHAADALPAAIAKRLGISPADLLSFTVFKRSYDARKATSLSFIYIIDLEVKNEAALLKTFTDDIHVKPAPTPDTTSSARHRRASATARWSSASARAASSRRWCWPRWAFARSCSSAARRCERTQDTWGLWRKNTLNPESNVQFGEGGAGTFSDGKLYSQIKDPKHYGRKVLTEFVKAGAPEEILYVSKPHIGTFRLVGMVENMRAEIRELGGEIRFEQRVTELIIDNGQVRGVKTATGDEIDADHVVLALGHSARDTFEMLHDKGVFMEAKPFSVGFRIEHPQSLIDKARLGPHAGHPLLGAADYKLVHHAANGRAVYSFCMCPGGTVVAATSEPNRVVTNGMSQYSRNERNANAGIVVGITPEDYPGSGPLAGIALQRELESRAFELGGGTYEAPGQLVGDFLQGKPSTKLGSVEPSYKPGVRLGDLSTALPDYAIAAIREAIPAFDRQIRGFNLYDAVLTGVETRTSSPLRITRGDDLQSLNVKGLYPAGEGAGYAGGILSAGVDGIKVAEAVALDLLKQA
jgi:uncharacterized FAD-dependent dehydrogenase